MRYFWAITRLHTWKVWICLGLFWGTLVQSGCCQAQQLTCSCLTFPPCHWTIRWRALNLHMTSSWRKHLHTFICHTFRPLPFEVQPQIVLPFHEQMVHYRRCGLRKRFIWSLKKNMFSSCCHSESGSSSKVLLLSSSDQMSGTSWGCEGVFLWCYGCVCMFVMWQEVVMSGRRVLPDDGSSRSHVWDESGRGVGEEEINSYVKKRKIGAFTQPTGLPSPPQIVVLQMLVI